MPKYTVNEVLGIIRELTPEEKSQLREQLPSVLDSPSSSATSGQHMANELSGITVGENFNFQPVQNQGGNVNADMLKAFDALISLKQNIEQSDINPLIKDSAKEKVEKLEEALKQEKPNEGFVKQTVATLKQGLEGVQTLAGPTLAVAKLIANAWGIPVV
jgi:hypothetical protein